MSAPRSCKRPSRRTAKTTTSVHVSCTAPFQLGTSRRGDVLHVTSNVTYCSVCVQVAATLPAVTLSRSLKIFITVGCCCVARRPAAMASGRKGGKFLSPRFETPWSGPTPPGCDILHTYTVVHVGINDSVKCKTRRCSSLGRAQT